MCLNKCGAILSPVAQILNQIVYTSVNNLVQYVDRRATCYPTFVRPHVAIRAMVKYRSYEGAFVVACLVYTFMFATG